MAVTRLTEHFTIEQSESIVLIYGQGVNDMKGGDVIVIYALKALQSVGALDNTQIIVVFHGDEEDAGSPLEVSRKDLIDAAKRSDMALAFEASMGMTGTIARRGVSSRAC